MSGIFLYRSRDEGYFWGIAAIKFAISLITIALWHFQIDTKFCNSNYNQPWSLSKFSLLQIFIFLSWLFSPNGVVDAEHKNYFELLHEYFLNIKMRLNFFSCKQLSSVPLWIFVNIFIKRSLVMWQASDLEKDRKWCFSKNKMCETFLSDTFVLNVRHLQRSFSTRNAWE